MCGVSFPIKLSLSLALFLYLPTPTPTPSPLSSPFSVPPFLPSSPSLSLSLPPCGNCLPAHGLGNERGTSGRQSTGIQTQGREATAGSQCLSDILKRQCPSKCTSETTYTELLLRICAAPIVRAPLSPILLPVRKSVVSDLLLCTPSVDMYQSFFM